MSVLSVLSVLTHPSRSDGTVMKSGDGSLCLRASVVAGRYHIEPSPVFLYNNRMIGFYNTDSHTAGRHPSPLMPPEA